MTFPFALLRLPAYPSRRFMNQRDAHGQDLPHTALASRAELVCLFLTLAQFAPWAARTFSRHLRFYLPSYLAPPPPE